MNGVGGDGFGDKEWSPDFVEAVEKELNKELRHKGTAADTATSTFPSSSYLRPPLPQQHQQSYSSVTTTYSPPRELSQRPSKDSTIYSDRSVNDTSISVSSFHRVGNMDRGKDLQIQHLEGEIQRVSANLTKLEYECSELRKRTKKEERILPVSRDKEKGAGFHSVKNTDSVCGAVAAESHRVPQEFKKAKSLSELDGSHDNDRGAIPTCRTIGVQTEKVIEVIPITSNDDHPTSPKLSHKLLGIWQSTSDQGLGKKLISRLFKSCPSEFHALLGCMGMDPLFKMTVGSMEDQITSDTAQEYQMHCPHTSEAARVSHLYSVLTEINTGMLQLDVLFNVLVDLSSLDNVVIVHRSLRVLRVFLKHLLSLGRKSEVRDNVKVEGIWPSDKVEDFPGPECLRNTTSYSVEGDDAFSAKDILCRVGSTDNEVQCQEELWNRGTPMVLSCINWISFFEHMRQIAISNTEKCVRLEAVSMMNEIVMRNNSYTEREKFGKTSSFEAISQLLKKESGSLVQKEALHLLYLLLNCPKLLAIFCSGCEKGEITGSAEDNVVRTSIETFHLILEGLADCIACTGSGIQAVELRRNTVVVLSFLVSTGRPGVEILLNYKLPRDCNFLMLILQVLVSEMDIETTNYGKPRVNPDATYIYQARNLLMREVLILLNRLVSNSAYSASVLRVLTNTRDMASLTIDIAHRLTWQNQKHIREHLGTEMRECDIIELAQGFKKRVFAYLGENIS